MIKDIFYNYKIKYLKYVILIKSGNFYLALGDDAKVINNIFGYKIRAFSNTIKVGFPLCSLGKVVNRLDSLKVNYIVDGEDRVKFNKNHYNYFLDKRSNESRIDDINRKLLTYDGDIDLLLSKIEGLI